jgi:hypothetical protein
MYLHTGWDKFARPHNLEDVCLLTFLYEGGDEMIVKVFNKTTWTSPARTLTTSGVRVFCLYNEDGHQAIEDTNVGFWIFFLHI